MGLCIATDASAVFTFTALAVPRRVTLRVGSANAAINNVTFTVLNANVSPTPTPVTGVPGGGTPATTPAGGTLIQLTAQVPVNQSRTITLSVDSTAGLTCIGGSGCGTTVIPFSTISWTSYNKAVGAFAGQDIQDGAFTGGGSQTLTSMVINRVGAGSGLRSVMTNVLIFRYANATLYPSGRYSGRVVYTATNL